MPLAPAVLQDDINRSVNLDVHAFAIVGRGFVFNPNATGRASMSPSVPENWT